MELRVWDSRAPTAAAQQDTDSTSNASCRTSRKLSVDNCDDILCFLEDFGVIVCKQHCTAIINLDKHLWEYHSTPITARRQIIERFSVFPIVDPSTIELPIQRAVVQELGAPLDGRKCRVCGFITVNSDVIRAHYQKNHKEAWKGDKRFLYDSVKVQTLFRKGGLQKYFIVHWKDAEERRKTALNNVVAQQLDDYKAIQQQLKENSYVLDEAEKTDRTNWFNRTGWPEHLKKRNLVHLAHQIRLPDKDEKKLQLAAQLTEQLIEKCVRRLASLPRELRRWLRSAKQSEPDVRPLARLQNPESQATYASYIVRFVCYYLRVIEDEDRAGEDSIASSVVSSNSESEESEDAANSDSEGSVAPQRKGQPIQKADLMKDAREMFPWKDDQRALAGQLWFALDGGGERGGERGAQMEALLASLSSFLFTSTRNDVFSSGWVHYLAVLGIDAEMGRLRTAKNYSYMLAGMVYCGRVIAAEKLLPTAHSSIETDDDYKHFLEMRRQYLADGSLSPMSESISLLAYGKHIALNQGNAGNAYWSPDKKTFFLHGRPIVVERFCKMAQDMVVEVAEQLWRLMWVDRIEDRVQVDLARVEDDLSFTKHGISFVTWTSNKLSHGLSWMLTQARNSEGGMQLQTQDGRWRSKKVRQYLRQVDWFLELLLMCIHVTSGQPGRGSEITTIRHRNGQLQDRNVYVVDGQIMTVVRYHKSQSQWDKPKVVPRFLPARLGQVMAVYLVYLQPFREYLIVQALGGGLSDYVWSNEQGAWGTDRLTRVIKRETGKRLGVELHTLGYRHAAVGIGRVKVGESFGRGYQDEIGEVDEVEVDEDQEDILELQNSRTTAMGVGNYSVPIDIIKHLSTRSIDAFRQLSVAWHRFLGVDEMQAGRAEASGRSKRRMRESMSGLALLPKEKGVRVEDARTEAVQQALQQVLGKQDVGFRSVEQEQALYAVLDNQSPLVVVLPTGGGKSVLFILPACIEEEGVTIVVVPYRALINDLVQRIQNSGVECIEWKSSESNPASVWVVSADKAGETGVNGNLLGEAQKLKAKGLLRRVVVDEAHLVFTSRHWRDKLLKVKNLRVLGCPIVLLTATLPPLREGDLESSMLVRHATYIRASTVRVNTQYFVSWCQRGKLESTGLAICKQWARRLDQKKQKGVVYCLSKQHTESLAAELGCAHYHADVVDRAERLQEWIEQGGLIVATSALGTGVDVAGIVYILHVGMPWSMTDFAQASGRGGRAGERVEGVVLVEHGSVESRLEQEGDDIDVQAMGQFLVGSGCRRLLMSSYMDKVGVSCREIEAVGCDRCGEGEQAWVEAQEEWAREWEAVERVFNELRDGCAMCWVVGQEFATKEEEQWKRHLTMQCKAWQDSTGEDADRFRQKMADKMVKDNCRRCWVSQRYCATGEGVERRCQWPNVVVPIGFAARLTRQGIRVMGEMGFQEIGDDAYAKWLGRRYREEVWGHVFSNAMVVAIRLVLEVVEEDSIAA